MKSKIIEKNRNSIKLYVHKTTAGKYDKRNFRTLVGKCVNEKYGRYSKAISGRKTEERIVITRKKCIKYFLVARDIVEFARGNDIFIGPGRGSAPGCITNYVLGITSVDPLKYGLIFERFLNKEDYSEPRIVIDISLTGFEKVREYIEGNYDGGAASPEEELTLEVIGMWESEAIRRMLKETGIMDTGKIPLEDKKTLSLLADGKTDGISQFESPEMKDLLRKVHPVSIDELMALWALDRPGIRDAGMVDDFIEKREAEQSMRYKTGPVCVLLKETHGVYVYQEQIMKILGELAGYNMSRADKIRRSMGAKKYEELDVYKTDFLDRSLKNNINRDVAKTVWNDMVFYAGYAFNKAHCAAYTLTGYYLAYMKANYPAEFNKVFREVTGKNE